MEDNNKNAEIDNSQLRIIDLIRIFLKNRKKIFLITGVFFIFSIIIYFFVLDLIYTSTASIKSSSKSNGLLGALESGLPDIGGIDELGIGGGKSGKELAAYEEILNSRRCIESIIAKFGLMERDDNQFLEDAIKNFREEKLEVRIEKLSGIMFVSVQDKDPVLAKQMVESLLMELDKINIELNVSNAKSNREFIEKRYFQSKEDMVKVEDSLKSFQQLYGIAPDLQIKASVQSVYALEAELKAEELKADILKKMLSSDQPEVKLQDAKITSLKNKIAEISSSTDPNDYIRLGNSPQIILSYLRLQRDLEIQTKIMTFLLPLYEQAKIEEKRETPTILILDSPVVAERKTKPKRMTMVIILTFLGFGIANVIYIAKYKWESYRASIDKI